MAVLSMHLALGVRETKHDLSELFPGVSYDLLGFLVLIIC